MGKSFRRDPRDEYDDEDFKQVRAAKIRRSQRRDKIRNQEDYFKVSSEDLEDTNKRS